MEFDSIFTKTHPPPFWVWKVGLTSLHPDPSTSRVKVTRARLRLIFVDLVRQHRTGRVVRWQSWWPRPLMDRPSKTCLHARDASSPDGMHKEDAKNAT
jgi:hypothetical protein